MKLSKTRFNLNGWMALAAGAYGNIGRAIWQHYIPLN